MNLGIIETNDYSNLVALLSKDKTFASLESIISKNCPSIRPYVYLKYAGGPENKLIIITCTCFGRFLRQYKEVFEYNVSNYSFENLVDKICKDINEFAVFLDNTANLQELLEKYSSYLTRVLGTTFKIEFELVREKNSLLYLDNRTITLGITLETLKIMSSKLYLFKEGAGVTSIIRKDEIIELININSDVFMFVKKLYKTNLGKVLELRIRQSNESILKKFHKVEKQGDFLTLYKEGKPWISYNTVQGVWVV